MTVFRRFPVIVALVALACAVVSTTQIAGVYPEVPAPVWWALMGVLAALFGACLGLPRWWLPFQLLAPTACALLITVLPSWMALVIVLILLLLYGGGVVTRVPLYLSNRAACEALVELLKDHPQPKAIDLGAGFGGPMRHLGRALSGGRFVSVEASPATWLIAWVLALPQRNVCVRWGDLWAAELADCDLVYVFLSPQPMPRLWEHFCAQTKSGTLLVSNTFPVPGVEPIRTIDLPGRDDARLFIYSRSSLAVGIALA